jgi:acetamidase/formamidase
VHWGFFDPRLPPALTVTPGDLVAIETLTHHAGDAPDLLMDAGIRDVFERVHDRGPGVHILTGPIGPAASVWLEPRGALGLPVR